MESAKRNCFTLNEEYWLFGIGDLLTNLKFIPNNSMNLGAKLNSMLRLSILIFMGMLLFGVKYPVIFLLKCVVMNIMFYRLYNEKYER
jgi:hypothetical protein